MPGAILNYTTTVAVEKTVADIGRILTRRGIASVSTHFDAEGEPSGITFAMVTEYGPREFALPIKTEGVLAALRVARKKNSRVQATPAQAGKVAWRIAKDWLEVQMALVDAELVKIDEVMLPWMIADSGTTMYELVRDQGLRKLEAAR